MIHQALTAKVNCGLGKTYQQLTWADEVVKHTKAAEHEFKVPKLFL